MRDSTLQIIMRETAPCDGCRFFDLCRTELMACRAFGYYVRSGVHNPDTPRNPSYTMYKKIFTEDESELLKLLREISKEENRE
jgi:hypothetical protein